MKCLSTFSVSALLFDSHANICSLVKHLSWFPFVKVVGLLSQKQMSHLFMFMQVCCKRRRWPLKLFSSAHSCCLHPTEDASSSWCVLWHGSARIPTYRLSMTPLWHAHWYKCLFLFPFLSYLLQYKLYFKEDIDGGFSLWSLRSKI